LQFKSTNGAFFVVGYHLKWQTQNRKCLSIICFGISIATVVFQWLDWILFQNN